MKKLYCPKGHELEYEAEPLWTESADGQLLKSRQKVIYCCNDADGGVGCELFYREEECLQSSENIGSLKATADASKMVDRELPELTDISQFWRNPEVRKYRCGCNTGVEGFGPVKLCDTHRPKDKTLNESQADLSAPGSITCEFCNKAIGPFDGHFCRPLGTADKTSTVGEINMDHKCGHLGAATPSIVHLCRKGYDKSHCDIIFCTPCDEATGTAVEQYCYTHRIFNCKGEAVHTCNCIDKVIEALDIAFAKPAYYDSLEIIQHFQEALKKLKDKP